MSSTDASTLSRWRPAVVVLSLAAGFLGIYYVRKAENEKEETGQRRLHRSNAIRRRSPRLRHSGPSVAQLAQEQNAENGTTESAAERQIMNAAREEAMARRGSFAGTLELPDDDVSLHTAEGKDGQALLNMLYQIALEQATREGYIHRGVTCNSCSTMPIKGTRYRCSNCPDYDLCEQCENLGNVHDRTHLFLKIRIPAPFLGANPRQMQEVWYPGKPHVNPRTIPRDLNKQLSESTGTERAVVDALWDQFKTLAGRDWPEDPNGLCIAIDRKIWARYCVPSLMKMQTAAMSLLFDRSLAFWDEDGNGLIGFEEFLNGIAIRSGKDQKAKNKRVFRAHDLDNDGYVTRQDFMSLFVSHYAYCKELSHDLGMFMEDEVLEGALLGDALRSTQTVSSCFHGHIPLESGGAPMAGHGKTMSVLGDMVITDGYDIVRAEDDGMVEIDREQSSVSASMQDRESVMADIFESLSQGMPDWPPDFVTSEDAQGVLGRETSLRDVTEIDDQRRILDAANRRLQLSTEASTLGRRRSEETIRSEHTGGDDMQAVNSSEDATSETPNSDYDSWQETYVPSANAEFLYQRASEGMNELLDPMFKQLEDLHTYYTRCRSERERLHSELEQYKAVPGNKAMCQHWLASILQEWRFGDTRKAWDYEDDMIRDILARLMRERKVGSQEWMSNAKERIKSGFTSEEDEKALIEKLLAAQGENNDLKVELLRLHIHKVRRGPLAREDDELLEPLSRRSTGENDGDRGENVFDVDDETIMDWAEVPALDELRTSRVRFEDSADLASAIDSRPVEELLLEAGHSAATAEAVASASDEDASEALPTEPVCQPTPDADDGISENRLETLDELRQQVAELQQELLDLGDDGDDMMSFSDLRDPTLPHNRPDHADDESSYYISKPKPKNSFVRWSHVNQKGTLASMEQQDPYEDQESDYFQVKLKYLTILGMYAENAKYRGGWARLNEEEFEEVMRGGKGPSLYPIGSWLDLASF